MSARVVGEVIGLASSRLSFGDSSTVGSGRVRWELVSLCAYSYLTIDLVAYSSGASWYGAKLLAIVHSVLETVCANSIVGGKSLQKCQAVHCTTATTDSQYHSI